MSLEAIKLEFIQRILKVEDEALIIQLDTLLAHMEAKDRTPMTLAELEVRIDTAIADAEAGRYVTSEELKRKIKGW